MARSATARLKFNPPLGNLPALQWALASQLQVDASYQRSLDNGPSAALVRKIAQHWNWDLCQPLVVSRRGDGAMYVIDGQHRLAAARLRGDITQLPCVVVDYASAADEAASFVHLNQQRRPLSRLDVFRAAVASEDPEACAIQAAIEQAGLSLAPHSNYTAWKPGMVSNIGGIESAWRVHGAAATQQALAVLAEAFAGEVLRYAGTIFPGIAALCGDRARGRRIDLNTLREMVAARSQKDWRTAMMQYRAREPDLRYAAASVVVLRAAWAEYTGTAWDDEDDRAASGTAKQGDPLPGFVANEDGTSWCDQCDGRVTYEEGAGCKSRFCSLRKAA